MADAPKSSADSSDETTSDEPIRKHWREVETRITQACAAARRERREIRLLAVSKTRTPAEIRALHELGPDAFGESYLDEALVKQRELNDLALEWHYIGPLQSNKTRGVAEHFDWVQSVDRSKIVRRLAEQRPAGTGPLNVLIQVNIDREPRKAGVRPESLEALADDVLAAPDTLRLRGLMAIPSADHDRSGSRSAFARMRELFDRLRQQAPGVDTLSMGMSGDLESAIAEGATMVRIGTALFGARSA